MDEGERPDASPGDDDCHIKAARDACGPSRQTDQTTMPENVGVGAFARMDSRAARTGAAMPAVCLRAESFAAPSRK
jgi:hypothetical protein